jgi:hypothetical protein
MRCQTCDLCDAGDSVRSPVRSSEPTFLTDSCFFGSDSTRAILLRSQSRSGQSWRSLVRSQPRPIHWYSGIRWLSGSAANQVFLCRVMRARSAEKARLVQTSVIPAPMRLRCRMFLSPRQMRVAGAAWWFGSRVSEPSRKCPWQTGQSPVRQVAPSWLTLAGAGWLPVPAQLPPCRERLAEGSDRIVLEVEGDASQLFAEFP